MQIKVTHPSDTEATVTVIADAKELATIKDHIIAGFAKTAKITGFREGKAPLPLVEKSVDPNQLHAQFLEEAVQELYFQAVNGEKLRVVASPKIDLKKFVPFTALEFEASVPVVGKVTIPDYTKIKLAPTPVTITAEDVTAIITNLQARSAERQPVERAAKDGDELTIDFKGVDAKTEEPINGADGKDYPLLLGSDTFIPGFETNLIGLKPGEDKTFPLTFPKDYGVKALANKKVTFTVTVTKVSEVVPPKADDAFAATVGPFKTLKELKEDIKKQLTVERQQEADRDCQNNLVKQIVEKTKVAIPEALIEEQIDRLEQEERQNLTYRGQTWQEHLEEEGVTAEEHRTQKRPNAEERIKVSLALAEIAEKEKLDVSPEELEVRIQILKGQYKDPAMLAELDKLENRRDIEARMLTEKTLDVLVAYASN